MKTRFNTFDLLCIIAELKQYEGLRVNQIYDIDNKTYLIRLQKPEQKVVLQLESGSRINTTDFEWPKNAAPSGFTMKLRKHLRNKRLECIRQLGIDRIVDLQFGSDEAAYHVFLELFDKGNIILTDHELTILNLLRPHTQNDRHRVVVREKYPVERARTRQGPPSPEHVKQLLMNAKTGDNLRKILTPQLEYGPALIDHCLLNAGFLGFAKIGQEVDPERDLDRVLAALQEAEEAIEEALKGGSKGYIIQNVEKKPQLDATEQQVYINVEFHPKRLRQHQDKPYIEFDSFDKAVDVFFSSMESQVIEMKVAQQERDAMKKLENVRRDHNQRLEMLENTKEADRIKAELILNNRELVDDAIMAIRTALANQMSWSDIKSMIKTAAAADDPSPIAQAIKELKLETNHIVLHLTDPYSSDNYYDNDDDEENDNDELYKKKKTKGQKPVAVTIDLDLTAFSNARRYFDQKRNATKKQQKTVESQSKALKSAEKKTKQSLKEMKTIVNISKARKVFWFEKFFWFISSENYLVIAGRDMMQNELIVKRYMSPGDIYVHADVHGASSIVIKNPSREPVPPKTLNEAGIMAICYSVAWEAKVIANAWWVNSEQVLKSAPSGEYLSTGSFFIRGKKNFLPPTNLILGFSFLFKLEESSIFRHEDERKIRGQDDDDKNSSSVPSSNGDGADDVEIALSEGDDDDDDDDDDDNDDEGDNAAKAVDRQGEDDDSEEEDNDHDDDEDNNQNQNSFFPDLEIKIKPLRKEVSSSEMDNVAGRGVSKEEQQIADRGDDSESEVVYLGDDQPVSVPKPRKMTKDSSKPPVNDKKEKSKVKLESQPSISKSVKFEVENKTMDTNNKLKRGQRSKLKKIKEKYKDQDDEDRQLRIELLQQLQLANGPKKLKKRDKKKLEKEKQQKQQQQRMELREKRAASEMQKKVSMNIDGEEKAGEQEGEDEEDEEENVAAAESILSTDLAVLPSLTGMPHPDDELLFAVPVVAPYATLQNYKYKVKLTPGTGKRGKAVRTALSIFLKEKTATQREKDVLKGVKDSDLSRNLPGKVKLSAPQLHKK